MIGTISTSANYYIKENYIPIVAVASVPGQHELLIEFFQHISPNTGFAYVCFQHQLYSSEDNFLEVLSKITSMKVVIAEDHQAISSNHVYIISSLKEASIIDGLLTLTSQDFEKTLTPLDKSFISLCDSSDERLIGVILSDIHNDGAGGLRAIKASGGITFAYNPISDKQNQNIGDIPDMRLSIPAIVNKIEQLSRQNEIFSFVEIENDKELNIIIEFLRKTVGNDFIHYDRNMLHRRIQRRMFLYEIKKYDGYVLHLKQNPEEAQMLCNDILMSTTRFFRDAETMADMKEILLPSIIKNKNPGETIRIWIPACSTGEEAYTLAIMLYEIMDSAVFAPVQIFGTDLNEIAINKARLGKYTNSEVAGLNAEQLGRFFTKVKDKFHVKKNIRDTCIFAKHDLFKDTAFSKMDLISCRNLLTYVDQSLQHKAFVTFHYALNHNGSLLLGQSEEFETALPLFIQHEEKHKLFKRKNDVVNKLNLQRTPKIPIWKHIEEKDPTDNEFRRYPDAPKTENDKYNLIEEADSLLLSQYIPASIVVDHNLKILHFRGPVSIFLEVMPGNADFSIFKMVRPELINDLTNAVYKARNTYQIVKENDLKITSNNKVYPVSIDVIPLTATNEEKPLLITFRIAENPLGNKAIDSPDLQNKNQEKELAELKENLRLLTEQHYAVVEELQTANDEVVSSNEELLCINEELKINKEELEFIAKHQIRNLFLQKTDSDHPKYSADAQLYSDRLQSVLNGVPAAVALMEPVFNENSSVPIDFTASIYNESTAKLVKKSPASSAPEISMTEAFPETRENGLLDMYVSTYLNGKQSYREVKFEKENGNKWLAFSITRQVDKKGIVVTISDITRQKEAEEKIRESGEQLKTLVTNSPDVIIRWDLDLKLVYANPAFEQKLGTKVEAVMGRTPMQIEQADDIAILYNKKLQRVLETGLEQEHYYSLGKDEFFSKMVPELSEDGQIKSILCIARNITDLKRAKQQLEIAAISLQAVLDSSPAAIGFLKAVRSEANEIEDFCLTVCNEKFLQLQERPAKELIGYSYSRFDHILWHEKTFQR